MLLVELHPGEQELGSGSPTQVKLVDRTKIFDGEAVGIEPADAKGFEYSGGQVGLAVVSCNLALQTIRHGGPPLAGAPTCVTALRS